MFWWKGDAAGADRYLERCDIVMTIEHGLPISQEISSGGSKSGTTSQSTKVVCISNGLREDT